MSIIAGGGFSIGGMIAETAAAVLSGFTSSNTANAKKLINNPKNSLGMSHLAFTGNSTKAGWGSNASAFGVPGTILAASRRSLSQLALAASAIASTYGITVSQDSFWGDAGWNTPFTNLTTFDPRISGTGSPTLSGTVLGPGGRSLTTTDATSTITFTPGTQFDRLTLFYAGTGQVFNVTGDVNTTPQASTAGSGNAIQKTTFSFASLNNSVTFTGTTATGMRVYGGYTWNSANPNVLMLHNMGWGNSNTANWSSVSVGAAPRDAINQLAPQLVMFSECINDPNTGVSLSTHNTNMTTFLNNVKNASTDVVVYDDHWTASSDVDGAAGHATLATLQAFHAANKSTAGTLGLPFVDSGAYFGSYAAQVAAGDEYDVSHFAALGQQVQAANLIVPTIAAIMAA